MAISTDTFRLDEIEYTLTVDQCDGEFEAVACCSACQACLPSVFASTVDDAAVDARAKVKEHHSAVHRAGA